MKKHGMRGWKTARMRYIDVLNRLGEDLALMESDALLLSRKIRNERRKLYTVSVYIRRRMV